MPLNESCTTCCVRDTPLDAVALSTTLRLHVATGSNGVESQGSLVQSCSPCTFARAIPAKANVVGKENKGPKRWIGNHGSEICSAPSLP